MFSITINTPPETFMHSFELVHKTNGVTFELTAIGKTRESAEAGLRAHSLNGLDFEKWILREPAAR